MVKGYSNSAISLTNAPTNWVVNVLDRHRERHRSFSTPEGCPTVVTESDTESMVMTSNNSASAVTSSRNLLHPFFQNPAYFRSIRSNPSRNDIHSGSTFGGSSAEFPSASLNTSFSRGTQLPNEVSVSHSAPVSSPASTFLSDECVSEKQPTQATKCSTFSSPRGHYAFTPLSRLHHHHFWHYPRCPHYQLHCTPSQDDTPSSKGPTTSVSFFHLFFSFVHDSSNNVWCFMIDVINLSRNVLIIVFKRLING